MSRTSPWQRHLDDSVYVTPLSFSFHPTPLLCYLIAILKMKNKDEFIITVRWSKYVHEVNTQAKIINTCNKVTQQINHVGGTERYCVNFTSYQQGQQHGWLNLIFRFVNSSLELAMQIRFIGRNYLTSKSDFLLQFERCRMTGGGLQALIVHAPTVDESTRPHYESISRFNDRLSTAPYHSYSQWENGYPWEMKKSCDFEPALSIVTSDTDTYGHSYYRRLMWFVAVINAKKCKGRSMSVKQAMSVTHWSGKWQLTSRRRAHTMFIAFTLMRFIMCDARVEDFTLFCLRINT